MAGLTSYRVTTGLMSYRVTAGLMSYRVTASPMSYRVMAGLGPATHEFTSPSLHAGYHHRETSWTSQTRIRKLCSIVAGNTDGAHVKSWVTGPRPVITQSH